MLTNSLQYFLVKYGLLAIFLRSSRRSKTTIHLGNMKKKEATLTTLANIKISLLLKEGRFKQFDRPNVLHAADHLQSCFKFCSSYWKCSSKFTKIASRVVCPNFGHLPISEISWHMQRTEGKTRNIVKYTLHR